MYKKMICVLLSAVLALSLCACGSKPAAEPVPETVPETTAPAEPSGSEIEDRAPMVVDAYISRTRDYSVGIPAKITELGEGRFAAQFFVMEFYHHDDVEKLQIGDNVMVNGEPVIVKEVTAEPDAVGKYSIVTVNPGTDDIVLMPDSIGEYIRCHDGRPVMLPAETREYRLGEQDFNYVELTGTAGEHTVRHLYKADFVEKIRENPDYFDEYSTSFAIGVDNETIVSVSHSSFVQQAFLSDPQAPTRRTTQTEFINGGDVTEDFYSLIGPVMPYTAPAQLGLQSVEPERIDGDLFLLKVMGQEFYHKEDEALLGIGSSIVIGGEERVIEDLCRLYGEIKQTVLTVDGKTLYMGPWLDNGDYYITDDESNIYCQEVYRVTACMDESVTYIDHFARLAGKMENLTGAEFVRDFTEEPARFTPSGYHARIHAGGTVSSIIRDAE